MTENEDLEFFFFSIWYIEKSKNVGNRYQINTIEFASVRQRRKYRDRSIQVRIRVVYLISWNGYVPSDRSRFTWLKSSTHQTAHTTFYMLSLNFFSYSRQCSLSRFSRSATLRKRKRERRVADTKTL